MNKQTDKRYSWKNRLGLLVAMMLVAIFSIEIVSSAAADRVIQAAAPTDAAKTGTKWTKKFADAAISYNSTPIVTESEIYVVNGKTLYVLDLQGNEQRQVTLQAAMNSVCYMEYVDGNLYIPLSGGMVECVEAATGKMLWVSQGFGGQSLSHLTIYQGTVSGGTVEMLAGSKTKGVYYCLDAATGQTLWSYESKTHVGGYYWSGGFGRGDRLYFTGDHGTLIEHAVKSDTVYGEYTLTDEAAVRSDFTYDETVDAWVVITNRGELCTLTWEGGAADSPKIAKTKLFPTAKAVNMTSTPTIYGDTLYAGSMADGKGMVCVWDLRNNKMRYVVETGNGCEVKASPLICVDQDGVCHVYYTYNALPGGMYTFVDTPQAQKAEQVCLYEPYKAKQYCMSSVTAGTDGTLYYSNDTGTLFAVAEVEHSSDRPLVTLTPVPSPTASAGTVTPTQTPNDQGKAPQKVTKPAKPTKIKAKKKKGTCRITWKKGKNATKTMIYVKVGKKKWKKLAAVSGKSYTISTKKMRSYRGKTVRIRLRSGRRNGKIWSYSGYSKSLKLPK